MPTPSEIKKLLVQAGLEVYQTRAGAVHLAERVRDNLIMDGRVRVHAEPPRVVVGFRAQRSDFPGETDDDLFGRARRLAEPAVERGFVELETAVVPALDPGGSERVLDVFLDVIFEKQCATLDAAVEEASFAVALEKAVSRR